MDTDNPVSLSQKYFIFSRKWKIRKKGWGEAEHVRGCSDTEGASLWLWSDHCSALQRKAPYGWLSSLQGVMVYCRPPFAKHSISHRSLFLPLRGWNGSGVWGGVWRQAAKEYSNFSCTTICSDTLVREVEVQLVKQRGRPLKQRLHDSSLMPPPAIHYCSHDLLKPITTDLSTSKGGGKSI